MLLVFGGIAGICLYLGMDEDSDFPEEAAYIILGACFFGFLAVFFQQMMSKVVLRPDGLEKHGVSGQAWSLTWTDVVSVAFDPTQGGFPLGSGIALIDRAGARHVVPRSIGNVQELGKRVLENHSRSKLGEVLLLLEAGDDIRFGDHVMVNRDMMRAPDPQTQVDYSYALRDFRGAVAKKGAFEISLAGKPVPLRIKAADLPNAHLLVPVLEKAKKLGPKVEQVLPVDHSQLERTDQG